MDRFSLGKLSLCGSALLDLLSELSALVLSSLDLLLHSLHFFVIGFLDRFVIREVVKGSLGKRRLDLSLESLSDGFVGATLVGIGLHDLDTLSLLDSDSTSGVLGHEDVDVLVSGSSDGNVGADAAANLSLTLRVVLLLSCSSSTCTFLLIVEG